MAMGTALTSKAVAVASAAAGVVAGILGVASLSVAEVDAQQGWDRSNHIQGLNIATVVFSLGSVATSPTSISGYLSLSHDVYGLIDMEHEPQASEAQKRSEKRLGAGSSAGRRVASANYRFTDAVGVSPFSKSYDAFRSTPKLSNLKRLPDRNQRADTEPTHNGANHFVDSVGDSAHYVKEFRKEINLIRQRILSELA